ncbi:MAG TPA: molecular chaperone HtpG [Pyrinomonadaceae bacterium]|nr:molecular chaperone HtpG [Pyrinomonadaceae bacterium]
MVAQSETFQFQAETTQLLDLMIHSLYTQKEIFLRELVSNASDALDRLRFEALTKPELIDSAEKLEIRLEVDRDARTLTIHDNGVGMSREEVINNIGTIAKSGTRELRERLKEGASSETINQLIGQFGVGFYSAFMVADEITLVTRRAGEESATKWESTGNGQYSVSEGERAGHGTSITLKLKPVDRENGLDDFTDRWVLSRIIKRYSDFVTYPIVFQDQRVEPEETAEDKVLNSMKPLWNRPSTEVTESEYAEFYKQITHDVNDPLKTLALKAEGKLEYRALLFIPSHAERELYYHAAEFGLRLYAKGVSIIDRVSDLLPRYLRFVRGVVDSADLPLNISRQMLQQDQHMTVMRKWLTKKILEALQDLYANDFQQYLKFWEQFGRAFKEGLTSDFDNKDKLLEITLFNSSNDPEKLTTLKDYVSRMPEHQNEIFYLTGESRVTVENSPHLEGFREKGYEVLYLIDPVDELVVQYVTQYEGKRLQSAAKGVAHLGDAEEKERLEKEVKEKQEEAAELLQFLQKTLDEHVKEVRISGRLTSSPACLVGAEHDYSPQLEKLLLMGKGAGAKQRRIMELNPKHEVFTRMQERFRKDKDDPLLVDSAELLLGYAMLAEGSELPAPVRFNRLLAEMMSRTL